MYCTPRAGVRRRLQYTTPRSSERTPRRTKRILRSRKLTSKNAASVLSVENKYFDTGLVNHEISSQIVSAQADSSTQGCLFCPNEGDGEQQREGNHVVINKIHIKGQVSFQNDATPGGIGRQVWARILLVLEKNTNNQGWTAAKSQQVLQIPSINGVTATALPGVPQGLAFRNMQQTSRFVVLKDMWIKRPNTEYAVTGTTPKATPVVIPFQCNIDTKLEVKFNSNEGAIPTVAQIVDNSLHVLAITESNSPNERAYLTYVSRCRFFG